MAENLNVKRREKLGGGNNRRLRRTGQVPAVLYGHGEASIPLAVESTAIMNVIRHGHKLVRLQGDVAEGAFIKAVQWDVYGKGLIHIDLLRVSDTEKVRTTVTIELKGTAVGLSEGGIIEFVLHELEIECPAAVGARKTNRERQRLAPGSSDSRPRGAAARRGECSTIPTWSSCIASRRTSRKKSTARRWPSRALPSPS